jgi:hypothetical protein
MNQHGHIATEAAQRQEQDHQRNQQSGDERFGFDVHVLGQGDR